MQQSPYKHCLSAKKEQQLSAWEDKKIRNKELPD
jgi:hypothetical protein